MGENLGIRRHISMARANLPHTFGLTVSVVVSIAFAMLPDTVNAWNRGGHLVTGALAYDELSKGDAELLTGDLTLLKAHPACDKWDRDLLDSPTVDRNKALFMLAAAFPDDARIGQFKRFDRPDWHYVNFRYTPSQPLTDVMTTAPFNGKLLDALQANLRIYRDSKAGAADRAVALSWVLHLTGDITQPLHVTALVNDDFPTGDRGGNLVNVRGSERATNSVKLHKIWDDGASGTGVKLAQAENIATQIRAEVASASPFARGAADSETLLREASNSYRLAVEQVYIFGKLRYSADETDDAPAVPDGYTKSLKALSQSQMVRASALATALLRGAR